MDPIIHFTTPKTMKTSLGFLGGATTSFYSPSLDKISWVSMTRPYEVYNS